MLRPRRVHLLPPVSYQGGKRRQAPEIVRHMALDPEQEFVELCAGSGAVSLELISRGHNPAKITMVDSSEYLSLFNADWPTPDLSNVSQLSMFDSPLVIEARAG